jgi:hypothetical protein
MQKIYVARNGVVRGDMIIALLLRRKIANAGSKFT